jgi:hypothetical protein
MRGLAEIFTCVQRGQGTMHESMGAPRGTGCDEGDKTGGGNEMQGNVGGWQMQGGKRETPGSMGRVPLGGRWTLHDKYTDKSTS